MLFRPLPLALSLGLVLGLAANAHAQATPDSPGAPLPAAAKKAATQPAAAKPAATQPAASKPAATQPAPKVGGAKKMTPASQPAKPVVEPVAKPIAKPVKPAPVVGGAIKVKPSKKAKRAAAKRKLKKSFLRGRRPQSQPLSTDRPGNLETATTVAVLHLQIETSLLWQKSKVAGLARNNFRFPTALRLGVLDRLELRLRGDLGVIETREGEDTAKGAADMVFGLRARVLDGKGFKPTLAVQFGFGIPTGSGEFTSKAVNPELQVNALFGLPAGAWLGFNTSVDLPNDVAANDFFWRWNGVAQLGYRPQAFDKLAAYVDILAALPLDRDRSAFDLAYFSGGLMYRITKDAQVDAYVQVGLTDAASDLGVGVGFSYRL